MARRPDDAAAVAELRDQLAELREQLAVIVAALVQRDTVIAELQVRPIDATASENIDRQDFDPVEEAEQVQLVVTAAGSGQAAAEHLQRSPGWGLSAA